MTDAVTPIYSNPTLPPHQQRVVLEHAELSAKLTKLDTFLGGGTYASLPPAEQSRMMRQFLIMQLYDQVLAERIAAFSEPAA